MSLDSRELKRLACQAIDDNIHSLNLLSQDLWSHPETAFEEHHAHDSLTTYLEKTANFPVVDRKYVCETGFRAAYGDVAEGKPHVAVLCEYDALPQIGHACGHNLIAEVGIAAGIGIKAAMDVASREGKSLGKMTILGTPAEEGGGGKLYFINQGAFKHLDAAMMCHPFPGSNLSYVPSSLCRQRFWVKYFGKASHAAGFPWEGVNALDAAVMAYTAIATLRQQIKPNWRIHGIITNGGVKPNIIPEETELEYYIRAPTLSELNSLRAKVTACFEAAAIATGCRVEFDWKLEPYYNVLTNPTLANLYTENAREIGVTFGSSESADAAMPFSTDMGNVSYVVPSIHPMYNIGSSAVNHTHEFTAASGDPKAQAYTLAQGKALAMAAIDIYCQPALVMRMKDELTDQLASH